TPTSAPTPPRRPPWCGRTSASPCRRTLGATTGWRRSRRCSGRGYRSRATGGCCPTRANRQPAAASYLRARGDRELRACKLDVLRVEGGKIAEITTFDAHLFPAFGCRRRCRRQGRLPDPT
ncbi:MAG TPA: hypothetical protein VE575_08990, partial [Acidimicrobiales bacterium]|nr:hypothetical protein [Acidimicrobiales bacterium]